MKKVIFSAFSLVMALMALCPTEALAGFDFPTAADSYSPNLGSVVDLTAFPGGVSGFEISGNYKIDRDCQEFIILKVNGKVVKQIPLSNERDVRTYQGFDVMPTGDLHVTFWDKIVTSPYKYTGNYTVIIPEGAVLNAAGVPNNELTVNYTILNTKYSTDPTPGSAVKTLDKIVFTFPDATSVTVQKDCAFERDTDQWEVSATGDSTIVTETIPLPTRAIGPNTAEVVFDPPLTTAQQFKLQIPYGAFKTTYASGPSSSTNQEGTAIFTVMGEFATAEGFVPDPQPGTYTEFKSFPIEGTETATTPAKQAYFTLTPPESMASRIRYNMASVKQYKLVNSETGEEVLMKGGVNTTNKQLYLTSNNYTEFTKANTLVPAPGTYDLIIPSGVYMYTDGTYSPQWTIGPYVVEVDENYEAPSYSLYPSNIGTVTFLKEVTVTFPTAEELWWNPTEYVTVKKGPIEYVARAKVVDNSLVITISGEIRIEGAYTFIIPGSAFKLNGRNSPISFVYDIALPQVTDMPGANFVPVVDESRIVNMEAYPAGLSNFEIDFNVENPLYPQGMSINRDARGFITLELNNEVLKQVPASNTVNFYTFFEDGDATEKQNHGNVHVTFFASEQDTPAKYSGRYRVTIPAGFLTDYATGKVFDEEIIAEYVISNQVNCVITPGKYSTVESLSGFTLEFPTDDVIDFKLAGAINLEFIDSTEDEHTLTLGEDNIKVDGCNVTVTFPEAYTTKGRLMVDIPYNTFVTYYSDGTAQASANQYFSYYIVPSAPATVEGYTITPAPGTYDKITSFPVTVGDKTYYAYFKVTPPEGTTANMSMGKAYLCPLVNGTYDTSKAIFSNFKGQVLTVDGEKAYYILNGSTVNDWYTQSTLPAGEGEYALVFAKNFFYNIGGANQQEIVYNYTFLGSDEVNYTVEPNPNEVLMQPLEVITITFPEAQTATLVPGTMASIDCNGIEYVATAKLDLENGVKLILTVPAPIVETGIYNVYVSPATFKVDGESTEIKIEYAIDSTVKVNELGVEADNAPIYNLQGVKVAEGAHNLRHLTPAVYIINGKKVIVK